MSEQMKDYVYTTASELKSLGVRFYSKEYENAINAHFDNWWNNYRTRFEVSK